MEQLECQLKYRDQEAAHIEKQNGSQTTKNKMWTDDIISKYTEDAEHTEQAEQQPKYAKQDAE